MKNTRINFIFGLLITLISCGQVMTEMEAIKRNEQGLAEYNAGHVDKAIILFKEAIKSPKLSTEIKAQIYRNIAQTFSEMKQQDSSIHYSNLAANSYDKNSYEYFVNISDVEIVTGKTADAILKLQKAVNMKPNELAANNTLGLIYLGDYGLEFADPEKALKYNKKAFEINNDRVTEDVLGRNYFQIGYFSNAEMHYSKLKDEYPDILPYSLSLGMIKYKLKKFKEAELLFDTVIKADSNMVYTIEAFKDETE
jgi:tetratricopeptide (TPR) repeat protein